MVKKAYTYSKEINNKIYTKNKEEVPENEKENSGNIYNMYINFNEFFNSNIGNR